MNTCELCDTPISKLSRYCEFHATERRRDRDRNRKRQMKTDGQAYQRVKQHQLAQRNAKRAWICEYLESHPCVDCGETDILVLEFDHTGEFQKHAEVTRILNGTSSLKKLQEEVSKCEVRCANDHRRKTIERMGGSYRSIYLKNKFQVRVLVVAQYINKQEAKMEIELQDMDGNTIDIVEIEDEIFDFYEAVADAKGIPVEELLLQAITEYADEVIDEQDET